MFSPMTSLDETKGLSAASRQHVAVMLDEVVGFVRASQPLVVVDVTVGTGGHAEALLDATDARLIGIDRDAAALAAAAAERLARFGSRVTLHQADFAGFGGSSTKAELPAVRRDCRGSWDEQLRARRSRARFQF